MVEARARSASDQRHEAGWVLPAAARRGARALARHLGPRSAAPAPTGALEAEADPTLVAVVVAATQVEPAEISQNLAAGMKMVAAVEVRTTPEQINRMLLVRIRVMVRFNCS